MLFFTLTGELNLVAMTEGGTRLYFTCLPRPGLGMTHATRPSTLKLAHIRLPPGYSPMSNMKRPSGSHIAYYGNGECSILSNMKCSLLLVTINLLLFLKFEFR